MSRDRLDDAIDAVAARMTASVADDGLAERILSSLPERQAWFGQWPLSRLAVTSALAGAIALVVLRSFDAVPVLPTDNGGPPTVELARAITADAPGTPIAERPQSPGQPVVAVTLAPVDHERSLVAIAPLEALGVESIAPDEVPAEDALAIAPLAIADLPLTAEFPPR